MTTGGASPPLVWWVGSEAAPPGPGRWVLTRDDRLPPLPSGFAEVARRGLPHRQHSHSSDPSN